MAKIKIASIQHFHLVKDFMKNYFFTHEPISKLLNLNENEIEIFMHEILPDILNENLSLISFNDNNELNGCVLCEDFYNKIRNENNYVFNKKFLPLFSLLEELDQIYITNNEINKNETFHLFMIATNEKGLSVEMTNFALEYAKKNHFKNAILEATGPISQFIAHQKLNFQILKRVYYNDFTYDNTHIFKGIEGTDCCILFEKKLS